MRGNELTVGELKPAQIMEMVQMGYNSLNPKDIDNFINNRPPMKRNIQEVFGSDYNINRSMGEAHMNFNKDMGEVKGALGEDASTYFEDIPEIDEYRPGNYRNVINTRMNLKQRQLELENKKSMKSIGTNIERRPQPSRQPIRENLIKDKKKAHTLGYNNGIDYINEFIELLKNPSSSQRKVLVEKLLQIDEDKKLISESVRKYYLGGITKSEKELYQKIKK